MDIATLRAHIESFTSEVDGSVADHLRKFADWLEGKQAEEVEAKQHIEWLQAHGYTVTK